jgi:WhiB family transcriptional regulator, redox-sensing transcriptional regulator
MTHRRPQFHGSIGSVRVGRGNIWALFELPPELWMQGAVCTQTDPEAFFPEKGGSTREAKRICQGCDVRKLCLRYALEHSIGAGIWGGYSDSERQALQRIEAGEDLADIAKAVRLTLRTVQLVAAQAEECAA